MKTTQYLKQEKAIAFCDGGGIRGRWRWGLRLLRDAEAISSEKSLKHGISEQLVAAAKRAGLNLSEREIRYRIQCARAYPTEGQIGKALADFATWWDLIQARFPPYPGGTVTINGGDAVIVSGAIQLFPKGNLAAPTIVFSAGIEAYVVESVI